MTLEFKFIAPSKLHAGGGQQSVSDIAVFLESEYGLVSGFTKHTKAELVKRVEKLSQKYLLDKSLTLRSLEKNYNRDLSGWLQSKWRDYINSEAHKIKTKAAEEEDRVSFVDTGDYFKSIAVRVSLKK